jgi:hypothetical protein
LASARPLYDGSQRRERAGGVIEIRWRQLERRFTARRDRLEEIAHRDRQRPRQANQDLRAGIGSRELDTTEVLVIQSSEFGEALLRQLALQP